MRPALADIRHLVDACAVFRYYDDFNQLKEEELSAGRELLQVAKTWMSEWLQDRGVPTRFPPAREELAAFLAHIPAEEAEEALDLADDLFGLRITKAQADRFIEILMTSGGLLDTCASPP